MFKKYEITFKAKKQAFKGYKAISSIVAIGYNHDDAINRLMKAKPFNADNIQSVKEII